MAKMIRLLAHALLLSLLINGAATARESGKADDCLQNVSDQVMLWTCGQAALPVSVHAHMAAKLRPVIITSADTIWVVDPGATAQQGLALGRALRTSKANANLRIINSRAQAEHVMASDRLLSLWPSGRAKQISLPLTQRLMQQRCVPCRQRLQRELGSNATRGTLIRVPSAIEVAQWPADAPFSIHSALDAAIEEDTWLLARDHAWVWVGMVVNADGIPDLQQGQVVGRLTALQTFEKIATLHPSAIWINSLGALNSSRIAEERSYFERWQGQAQRLLADGMTTLEALETLRKMREPLLSDSVQADDAGRQTHELNLQRIIRQAEEALFK